MYDAFVCIEPDVLFVPRTSITHINIKYSCVVYAIKCSIENSLIKLNINHTHTCPTSIDQ